MRGLISCAILVMLSHPVLGQGLSYVPGSNGGRAVMAYASDQAPTSFGAGSVVPAPVGSTTSVTPLNFGPPVRGGGGSLLGVASQIYAAADFIYMDRNNDSYHRSIVVDANSGSQLISTQDLDFDFEPGVRATVGWRSPCCWLCSAWEFTYLGIFDWDDSATVVGSDNLSAAGDLGFVVNGFTLAETMQTSYGSRVHSGEANCFKCFYNHVDCDHFRSIDWLWGLRYLKLDENLSLVGNNDAVAAALYDVDVNNNLYGAQLGARIRSFHGKWGWEITKKIGVYGNDESQRQQIIDELGVNDVLFRTASASGEDVAFVTDLSASVVYHVSRHCGLRCGYNLLWIDGVALAANQLDFNDLIDSGTSLRDGDDTFLHGLHVGFEVNW